MRRTAGTILFAIILTALTVAGTCTTSLAAGWPAPPDGWWKNLSPGDTATFEIVMNAQTTEKMEMIVEILDVEGSKITFSTKMTVDGTPLPEQKQTVDVNSKAADSTLPGDAVVTKIGEKVFKASGESFTCTEYKVKTYNATMNICHSPELPVIFSGGNVVMETKSGSVTSKVTLKEYTGKKIKE